MGSRIQPAGQLPAPGTVLDSKLEIVRVLGSGGMGAVLEARNRLTGRAVAVKVLRPELAANADAVRRLMQEASVCGRIQHPHVVDVYDAGVFEGAPYIVMELLRGESLAERASREGPLPIAEAVTLVLSAARGVAAAHAEGVIHRDLKPDNFFLAKPIAGGPEVLKVLDFGISKLLEPGDFERTRTGQILGTPYYMSPEQARGLKDIDPRTDVYSLGTVLFFLTTGCVPFEADNYNALMLAIISQEPPDVRALRPGIPEDVAAVIERAMAREREGRYASAAELVSALEAVQEQSSPVASVSPAFVPTGSLAITEPRPFVDAVPAPLRAARRRRLILASIVAGALLVLLVGLAAAFGGGARRAGQRAPRAAAAARTTATGDVVETAPASPGARERSDEAAVPHDAVGTEPTRVKSRPTSGRRPAKRRRRGTDPYRHIL